MYNSQIISCFFNNALYDHSFIHVFIVIGMYWHWILLFSLSTYTNSYLTTAPSLFLIKYMAPSFLFPWSPLIALHLFCWSWFFLKKKSVKTRNEKNKKVLTSHFHYFHTYINFSSYFHSIHPWIGYNSKYNHLKKKKACQSNYWFLFILLHI